VKGGPDYNTRTIEGPTTKKVYAPINPGNQQAGVSHYGYKVKQTPPKTPDAPPVPSVPPADECQDITFLYAKFKWDGQEWVQFAGPSDWLPYTDQTTVPGLGLVGGDTYT